MRYKSSAEKPIADLFIRILHMATKFLLYFTALHFYFFFKPVYPDYLELNVHPMTLMTLGTICMSNLTLMPQSFKSTPTPNTDTKMQIGNMAIRLDYSLISTLLLVEFFETKQNLQAVNVMVVTFVV